MEFFIHTPPFENALSEFLANIPWNTKENSELGIFGAII